jgi:WD40 repeat protein
MDVDTLNVTPIKVKEKESVEDLEWFKGEDYVLAAFNDGSMRIYDFANPDIAQVFFTPHTQGINSIGWINNKSGDFLTSSKKVGALKIWNVA